MIVYKVDKSAQQDVNTQIRDMGTVLSEIAPTLRYLRELLNKHQETISAPSINQYRDEIQRMIAETARLTHVIAISTQRLSKVSEQAVKELGALDEEIEHALQGRPIPEAKDANGAETISSADSLQPTNAGATFNKLFSRV